MLRQRPAATFFKKLMAGPRYINVLSRMTNELTTEAKLLLFRSFIFSHIIIFLLCILWVRRL